MTQLKNLAKNNKNAPLEFARYGGTGLAGTAVHYGILAELLKRTDFGVVLASTGGALAGTIINYILHYFYTFRSRKNHRAAFARFWLISAMGWGINAGILFLNARLFKAPTIPAQLIATAVAFVFAFEINRKWTF